MKKLFLSISVLFLFAGCSFGPSEISEIDDQNLVVPNEESAMTQDEAKQKAVDYIMGMKEYVEKNGYHLEEIDTVMAGCPDCYIFKYEFRLREGGDSEVTGVANVTLTMFYGNIANVIYWDDVTNEEVELEVQKEPLIGGQRDEHGCLGPAGYTWCEVTQKCQRLWEEPCMEDSDFDISGIKNAFLKKYPEWEGEEINITVSKQYGNFASGGVNFANADAGGGYFFAVETGDGWVIAADGNGTIGCDEVEPYNFPEDMISECWDESTNTLKRITE